MKVILIQPKMRMRPMDTTLKAIRRMPKHQKAAYLPLNVFYRKYGHLTERICRAIGYQRIGRLCENLAYHFSRKNSRI